MRLFKEHFGKLAAVLCDGDVHGLGVVVVMHDDTKGMFSFYLWFVVILHAKNVFGDG